MPVFETASFGRRIGGALVDGLLLGFVGGLVYWTNGWVWTGVVASAAITIVGVAVWGQTPGKALVGTRVVSDTGVSLDPPGWVAATLRHAVFALPAFLPSIGELVSLVIVLIALYGMANDPRRRGIHDVIAGTRVVTA